MLASIFIMEIDFKTLKKKEKRLRRYDSGKTFYQVSGFRPKDC